MKTFVFGDVHGKLDMLLGLLVTAGIMDASGKRIDNSVRVISVGDLGNFSEDSRTEDYACYRFAAEHGIEVLWGNHDRAVVDPHHKFSGYARPLQLTRDLMTRLDMRLAAFAEGFLITHAGVHPGYVPYLPTDRDVVQHMYNVIQKHSDDLTYPLIKDIGTTRGGPDTQGGLLWRDADREKLARFPQVFGHTKGYVRRFNQGQSICIDAGVRKGNLAGVWLPSMTVVAIGPDSEINMIGEDQ
jgi:hypothetical protein